MRTHFHPLDVLFFILVSLSLYPLLGVASMGVALLFCLLKTAVKCMLGRRAPPPGAPTADLLQQQRDAQRDVILALCETLAPSDAAALRAILSGGDAARDGGDYEGLQLLDTLWGGRASGAPPPLAAAAVEALSSRAGLPDDGPCAVCLDPVAPSQPVIALPCLHVFHAHCIRTWLLESAACPVCRFKFVDAAY